MNAIAAAINRKESPKLAAAGLRTFFNIAKCWDLTAKEQCVLLGCAESTFYKWKDNPNVKLTPEKLERLSYILGIYKNLQVLFPHSHQADAWLKKPNLAPIFGGKSALDRMLSGNVADLYVVRQYLDAQRGGW
ncbi:MAG: DUF2384 domain-containing protein [Candidatus Omnitrophota bacterium]|jgi:uncharacterized protein (DUF2384 family)|nr:MAG: DUF2384 domain-containing protein [Candidatus Omnitrophota bacterium]